MNSKKSKFFIPIIASLVGIAPLSIDTYLPALVKIANDLSLSIHQVEQSINTFMLGFAVGMLFGGTLSDHKGRKMNIYIGLSIFIISSLLVVNSNSIYELHIYRFLQAFGGAMASVAGPAIIRDTYSTEKELAGVFTLLGLITMLAPLLAPGIGAGILYFFNWESIFYFLALFGLVILIGFIYFIPETRAKPKEKINFKTAAKKFSGVLFNKEARVYLMVLPLAFGVMFMFVTESAFIYLKYFNQKPEVFPLLFGLNIIGMMLFNRLNSVLLKKYEPFAILKNGLLLQTFFTLLLFSATTIYPGNLYIFLTFIVLSIGCMGIIGPNATSGYLRLFPESSAVANSIIMTIQFMLGAILGLFVTSIHNSSLVPITLSMLTVSTIASLLILKSKRLAH